MSRNCAARSKSSLLRRLAHLLFEPLERLPRFPGQELARGLDPLPVLLGGDVRQLHRHLVGRALQLPLRRHAAAKRQHAKPLPHERERLPQRPGVRKRPEIPRLVIFLESRQPEPRPLVRHVHFHQQEAFVVAEGDIVARAVFLDQPSLEQQRLRLGPHRVKLKIPDAVQQRPRLQVGIPEPGRQEIRAHPLPQVARLAHIDHPVQPVAHQVHARLVGQIMDFFRQVGFGAAAHQGRGAVPWQ